MRAAPVMTFSNEEVGMVRSSYRAVSFRHFSARALAPFFLALSLPAQAFKPDATGGGYAQCGMLGEYFANPDLSGAPAFTRRDVRIDFDWGTLLPVGGSNSAPMRAFPRDNFSVRWIGSLIARFSEAYVFFAAADEGVRVRIRPAGSSAWTAIIDNWNSSGVFASAPQNLSAGQAYDLQVEYHELSGQANCRLSWRSPSTPTEVIDPVAQQGLNATSWYGYEDQIWADRMKAARWDEGKSVIDSLGWPRDSAVMVMSESDANDPVLGGTYLLSFNGEAQIKTGCCNTVVFSVGGQTYTNQLARGVGYDAATNTTFAEMNVNGSRLVALGFYQTSRNNSSAIGTGITNIKLMRPLAPDSTAHHDTSEVVARRFKQAVRDYYTCLRWLEGSNGTTDSLWSDRTRPGYAFFSQSKPGVTWSEQENWEYLIMLANETGKDLYLTLPIKACDDYFVKLADLLKYGSDGVLPYTGPQADPRYPPLNPNLRVYMETGNEIWNWAFASTQTCLAICKKEAAANSAVWQVMNYDGKLSVNDGGGIYGMRRWLAIRTVNCSNAFRAVFGNAGMGPRIRMLTEYQYDNAQETADRSFQMFDGYYNNGTGAYVGTPHPPSYYLWGAGGATYYGTGNTIGKQSAVPVPDSGFESPVLSANSMQYRPSGTVWSFTGTAGIYRQSGGAAIAPLGTPDTAPQGSQAAFIIDSGTISATVNFTQTGFFALAFNAALGASGKENDFDIFFDAVKISPLSQADDRVSAGYAGIGGWARNVNDLASEWGSAVFKVASTGNHTIKFAGRGRWGQYGGGYVLFDNIRIASVDSIMESGFGSGQAAGQVADDNYTLQLNAQAKYARTFGLQVIAYEAGWSLGGDFTQRPIQNWCKLHDGRATRINNTAQDIWARSGSFLNVWGVYVYWPGYSFSNIDTFPLVKSLGEIAGRVPAECENGKIAPCVLRGIYRTDDVSWSYGGDRTNLRGRGSWASWLFVTPDRQQYSFTVFARGRGGYRIMVDDSSIGTADPVTTTTPYIIDLVKGGHAVRAQSIRDTVVIDSIVIAKAGFASVAAANHAYQACEAPSGNTADAVADSRQRAVPSEDLPVIAADAQSNAALQAIPLLARAPDLSPDPAVSAPQPDPLAPIPTAAPEPRLSAIDKLEPLGTIIINQNGPARKRLRGYLIAPATGNFRLYLAAVNQAELYLSVNDDPAKAARVAWTRTASDDGDQFADSRGQSFPVAMVSGRKYYFEVFYTLANGKGTCRLAWAQAGEFPRTIAAESVVPFKKDMRQ
jgi:hypothetical protein